MGTGLWAWGYGLVPYTYDEVFSAVWIADSYPFQALSYYMLPNNHVLFNLHNNLLPFEDPVASGRFLSYLAYIFTLLLVWAWFRKIFNNRWFALLAVFVIAAHFPVWGFSFQARGYAYYIWAHWACFISLYFYLRRKQKGWLLLYIAGLFVGYTTMPSFLYFHAALLLYFLFLEMKSKVPGRSFWKGQAIGISLVYLFYLPGLAFSGLAAFVSNAYVRPMEMGYPDFIDKVWQIFRSYSNYTFSWMEHDQSWLGPVLLIVPAVFILTRDKKVKSTLIFYLIMWIAVTVFVLIMKKFPYHRTLAGQLSFSLSVILILVHYAAGKISEWTGKTFFRPVVFFSLLVFLFFFFLNVNKKYFPFYLYYYNAEEAHEVVSAGLNKIPEERIIGFTHNAFYPYYLAKKRGYKVKKCIEGTEKFIVKNKSEQFPASSGLYEPSFEFGDYVVFKRGLPK